MVWKIHSGKKASIAPPRHQQLARSFILPRRVSAIVAAVLNYHCIMEQAMASTSQHIARKPQAANNLGPPVACENPRRSCIVPLLHNMEILLQRKCQLPTLHPCGTKLRLPASEKNTYTKLEVNELAVIHSSKARVVNAMSWFSVAIVRGGSWEVQRSVQFVIQKSMVRT